MVSVPVASSKSLVKPYPPLLNASKYASSTSALAVRTVAGMIAGISGTFASSTPAAVSNVDDPEFMRLTGFLSKRRPASPVKITRTTGANDSRYFPQFKKPMVGVGGVVTHGAHSDDEWIDLDTIGPQVDLMCDFMRE